EAQGEGDAPWPPNYAKQAGEPPWVQPSRARRPKAEYEQGRGIEGGPPPEVAAERAAAVAAGDRNAGLPTEWPGMPPRGTRGGSRGTAGAGPAQEAVDRLRSGRSSRETGCEARRPASSIVTRVRHLRPQPAGSGHSRRVAWARRWRPQLGGPDATDDPFAPAP